MPVYAYRAFVASGGLVDRSVEATSESHARSVLADRGERVVQISEAGEDVSVARRVRGKKPPADEVASTIRQLSILIRAGVPLLESLNGLSEQAKTPSLSESLADLGLAVSQGSNLGDAFSRHPAIFPVLAVEMARVAEAGGNLAESMERLADHMETGAEIGRKVKSALAYPLVLLCISVATVLVMVTFILPRFMKLFGEMHIKLPWTTKAMMAFSNALMGHWYLFIGGSVGAYLLVRHYLATPGGKLRVDAMVLKLPIVGDVIGKIVLSRVVASMATLLSSGVPMVRAMEISASAADNRYVREALLRASTEVAHGSAPSQSLKDTGVFPPLLLQMVASGEKTGELPLMLSYVCSLYARETDAKVKSLTSIIEPIMIVVMGVVVGFIALSVIVPIYSLIGGVK